MDALPLMYPPRNVVISPGQLGVGSHWVIKLPQNIPFVEPSNTLNRAIPLLTRSQSRSGFTAFFAAFHPLPLPHMK